MLKYLTDLCSLNGVSSFEEPVRAYLRKRAEPYADAIRVDAMGNLIVFKKGAKTTGNRLMLTAHMDEVGFLIRRITEDGYLKFDTIGGIDRRVIIGKPVLVGPNNLPGVVGLKAYHLVSKEEEQRVPKIEDMYIDIGAGSLEEAKSKVQIGDYIAFQSDCKEFGDHMLKAKAIDDRVGCAVLLSLLETDLPMDCTFVFSVQEEVGTRGAFGAAFSVKPEIALIIEGTTAADSPAMEPHKKVCAPGKGPVIPFMDGGSVYDRKLFELLRDLAVRNDIPWQTKHYISGGTDAGAISRSREGVRVAAISAAVRYLHAPSSVASTLDFDNMRKLSALFIEAVSQQEVV
ncbi:MAG: M42 family metallopeptidase [Pseudoflavonifractor sp.]